MQYFKDQAIFNAEHQDQYDHESDNHYNSQNLNLDSTSFTRNFKLKKEKKRKRKKKTAKQLITIQINSIPLAKTIDEAILHGASTSYSFSYNTSQLPGNVIKTIPP